MKGNDCLCEARKIHDLENHQKFQGLGIENSDEELKEITWTSVMKFLKFTSAVEVSWSPSWPHNQSLMHNKDFFVPFFDENVQQVFQTEHFLSPFLPPHPLSTPFASSVLVAAPPVPLRWQVSLCWHVSWLRARSWLPTSSSAREVTSNLWRSGTKIWNLSWVEDQVRRIPSVQTGRDVLTPLAYKRM